MRHSFAALIFLLALRTLAAPGHAVSTVTYGASAWAFPNAVASNGSTFLTVWRTNESLFVSVADGDGRNLTPAGHPLPTGNPSLTRQLLPIGTDYLLVWSDSWDVSAEWHGIVITDSLEIRRTFELPRNAGKLAWNGTNLLAVTVDDTNVHARLLDLNGRVVQSTTIATGVSQYAGIEVTRDGDGFAAAVSDGPQVTAYRIGADGSATSSTLVTTFGPAQAIVSRNGELLVLWWNRLFERHRPLYLWCSLIDPENHVTHALVETSSFEQVGLDFLYAHADGDGYAVFLENGYAVSITSPLTVERMRIARSPAGPVVTRTAFINESASRKFRLFARGPRILYAVATEYELADRDPYLRAARVIAGPFPAVAESAADVLSIAPRPQTRPMAASSGVDFLAGWVETTADSRTAAAAPIRRDGLPVDDTATEVVSSPVSRKDRSYALAFGGSAYLAVWTDSGSLRGRMLLPSGQRLDSFTIRNENVEQDAGCAVTWNGRQFFAVWAEGSRIFGATVSADGVAGPPVQLSDGTADTADRDPAVAWNGGNLLVAWRTVPAVWSTPGLQCRARLLTRDGQPVGDPVVIAEENDGVRLASNGDSFLVMIRRSHFIAARPAYLRPAVTTTVTSHLLHADGGVITKGAASTVFNFFGPVNIAVTSDGNEYIAALRYGVPAGEFSEAVAKWVAAVRITRTGVEAGRRFTPIPDGWTIVDPAIAANQAGDALILSPSTRRDVGAERLYAYLESELEPLPEPPQPPVNVVAERTLDGVQLSWSGTQSDAAYVIDARSASDLEYTFVRTVPGNVRSTTLPTLIGWYRVRALGPAGLSAPSATAWTGSPRRRAAGR